MAARKAARRAGAIKRTKKDAKHQLKLLRTRISAVSTALRTEIRKHQSDLKLLDKAQKSRARLAHEIAALRNQRSTLSGQLRKSINKSGRKDRWRSEPSSHVARLKKELARRTDAFRRRA